MTSALLSRAALSKEIRGLLPLWVACLAALAGAFVSRSDGVLMQAAIVAYIVGPIALGAQSIGQEYAYGTLPMLLSQPADRRRVFFLKFAVLAVMVLTLAALAWTVLMGVARDSAPWRRLSVQVLPVLAGLFAAPWVTMICRSPLAGILGTTSFASLVFIIQMAIVGVWFGVDAGTAQAMSIGPWSLGMIACCAVGGVLGVRRFIHLEAIEGPSPSLHLPRWLARSARTRVYQPLRSLAVKELRLQHLTFVMAGLFIIGTLAVGAFRRVVPLWSALPMGLVAQLYCVILSVWIGSVASAEERQHRTLEWQLLQPTPAWQQWVVKVAVVLMVALVCGVGLPVLLFEIMPAGDFQIVGMPRHTAVLVVLLTTSTIYISSLSSNGVRAMVLALPIGAAVELWVQAVTEAMRWGTLKTAGPLMASIVSGAVAPASANPADVALYVARACVLTLAPLLLWFGFVNHTSSERSFRRIVLQGASIALIIMTGVILTGGALAFYELRSR